MKNISEPRPRILQRIQYDAEQGYRIIGARGIWTTHFHELCLLEKTLTEGKSVLGNLSAEMDTDSHRRLFRIRRGDGERKSYALDIAAQYHLTAEEIVREKNPLP